MGKQISQIQISGKSDGRVYYRPRYADTGLFRRADVGASERVKTAPEYQLFRVLGKEFGMVGAFGGAFLSAFPDRAKTMLNPYRMGYLTKYLLRFLGDSPLSLGSRDFTPCTFVEPFTHKLQMLCKNNPAKYFGANASFMVVGNLLEEKLEAIFSWSLDDEHKRQFENLGITDVRVGLYLIQERIPTYQESTGEYTGLAVSVLLSASRVFNVSGDGGVTINSLFESSYPEQFSWTAALVVVEPLRVDLSGVLRVLNQHCFFSLYPSKISY